MPPGCVSTAQFAGFAAGPLGFGVLVDLSDSYTLGLVPGLHSHGRPDAGHPKAEGRDR